jgi:hypothetical protein
MSLLRQLMKQEMKFSGRHIDNDVSSDTQNIIFLI